MFRITCLTILLSVCIFGALSCKTPVVFEGTSMLPTIKNGDRILMDRLVGDLKHGEIIQFKYPKDTSKFYMKRIIALPNETVEIREGVVFIDGKELQEDYVDQEYNQTRSNWPPQPRRHSTGN